MSENPALLVRVLDPTYIQACHVEVQLKLAEISAAWSVIGLEYGIIRLLNAHSDINIPEPKISLATIVPNGLIEEF